MNFQLHKISKVEEIDINKFLGARVSGGGGGGISDHEIDTPRNFVQSLRSKHMKYDDETFERKFQFRYLLRAFQTFMLHHKKNFSNSCDTKNNKNKLILPNISTFNNSKNDSQAHRRSFFGLKNITQPLLILIIASFETFVFKYLLNSKIFPVANFETFCENIVEFDLSILFFELLLSSLL